ncbi:hypothetical protein [Burkholderia multivorans]|uniref:Uncharacterized protein n=1 Tax=Burkholderia multivorans CGD2 TaxID=513052 RepID=B9BY88_9BURK|nr:hypothetical protein [Burkholderia multivorans]EEE04182.1 hypothetical protein BURMUCGD2_1752 [Burkholderia multivorans CGD2]EEE14515.1 hypothetical protein BURMUCGD2M_1842 [Burkholderia multivorans CGD2M]
MINFHGVSAHNTAGPLPAGSALIGDYNFIGSYLNNSAFAADVKNAAQSPSATERAKIINGYANIGAAGLVGDGAGLHGVKLSTDHGSIQAQMDRDGTLFNKKGVSIGKMNPDGSIVLNKANSRESSILSGTEDRNTPIHSVFQLLSPAWTLAGLAKYAFHKLFDKEPPPGRRIFDAAEITVSGGDLQGTSADTRDTYGTFANAPWIELVGNNDASRAF